MTLHYDHMQMIHFRNAHPDAVEFTTIDRLFHGHLQIEAGDQVLATSLATMQRLPQDGSMAGAWWVLVTPCARFYRISPDDFATIGGAVAA